MAKKKNSQAAEGNNNKKRQRQPTLFASFLSTKAKNNKPLKPDYKIFCDLDGVLVDFEKGVHNLTGLPPSQLHSSKLWKAVLGTPHFYRDLHWTHDGQTLWDTIRPYNAHILTGVPKGASSQKQGGHYPGQDKYEWCQRELCCQVQWKDMAGPKKQHVRCQNNNKRDNTAAKKLLDNVCTVITCWSKNKHCESRPNHVLIDDRESLRDDWENAGGIFILHENTTQTLDELRSKGILPPPKDNNEATAAAGSEVAAAAAAAATLRDGGDDISANKATTTAELSPSAASPVATTTKSSSPADTAETTPATSVDTETVATEEEEEDSEDNRGMMMNQQ